MSSNNKQDQSNLDNAEDIINCFGGIRPMATKMEVPVTTVQGWKKRNSIPANRKDQILEAAAEHNIDLSGVIAGAKNDNNSDAYDDEPLSLTADQKYDGAADAEDKNDSKPMPSFSATPSSDDRSSLSSTAHKAPASSHSNAEDFMKKIKQSQSRAVWKSTAISTALIVGMVVVGGVLLWPTHQDVSQNTREIATLKTDVAEVKTEQSGLRNLVPANIGEKFQELRVQADDMQMRVGELSKQAEAFTTDVMQMDGQALQNRVAQLEERMGDMGAPSELTALMEKVGAMQSTLEGQTQLSSSVADLSMLVENMRGRMDQLDGELASAQQEDDALGQTLDGVSQTDLKAAAYLLALSQLRSALNRNGPFAEDLVLMQGLIGEDDPALQAAITKLAPKAEQGVLTPEGLSGEFKGLAGDIVVSSLKGEDVSAKEKAMARFNQVLEVKKDGELITGTDTQATVARAQKLLDAGDVQGALTELKALDGEAAETAKPWMEEAEMTLLAHQVQEMMTVKVMDKLPSGGLDTVTDKTSLMMMLQEMKNLSVTPRLKRGGDSGVAIFESTPASPGGKKKMLGR